MIYLIEPNAAKPVCPPVGCPTKCGIKPLYGIPPVII